MKIRITSMTYIIWTLIFTIIPIFLVLIFAFMDTSGNLTLNNIIKVGQFSNIFFRSIVLGAISTVICLILAYPFAYILSKLPMKNQSLVIMLIMLPMWMNFLLRTYAWMTILEHGGLLNKFLSIFNIKSISIINTPIAVIIGMVYNFLPYMILPIYNILTKLDKKIIEAAQDLGANRRNIFIKILIPLSMPGILSGINMVFIPAVSTFIISKMLGGGSNMLIGDLIEMQFLGDTYNPNLGSAMAFILMILMFLSIGIVNQFDYFNENSRVKK